MERFMEDMIFRIGCLPKGSGRRRLPLPLVYVFLFHGVFHVECTPATFLWIDSNLCDSFVESYTFPCLRLRYLLPVATFQRWETNSSLRPSSFYFARDASHRFLASKFIFSMERDVGHSPFLPWMEAVASIPYDSPSRNPTDEATQRMQTFEMTSSVLEVAGLGKQSEGETSSRRIVLGTRPIASSERQRSNP